MSRPATPVTPSPLPRTPQIPVIVDGTSRLQLGKASRSLGTLSPFRSPNRSPAPTAPGSRTSDVSVKRYTKSATAASGSDSDSDSNTPVPRRTASAPTLQGSSLTLYLEQQWPAPALPPKTSQNLRDPAAEFAEALDILSREIWGSRQQPQRLSLRLPLSAGVSFGCSDEAMSSEHYLAFGKPFLKSSLFAQLGLVHLYISPFRSDLPSQLTYRELYYRIPHWQEQDVLALSAEGMTCWRVKVEIDPAQADLLCRTQLVPCRPSIGASIVKLNDPRLHLPDKNKRLLATQIRNVLRASWESSLPQRLITGGGGPGGSVTNGGLAVASYSYTSCDGKQKSHLQIVYLCSHVGDCFRKNCAYASFMKVKAKR